MSRQIQCADKEPPLEQGAGRTAAKQAAEVQHMEREHAVLEHQSACGVLREAVANEDIGMAEPG